MQRKTASGVILTLTLIGVLTLAFNIYPVKGEPRSWIVDDDGPADFSRIQEAINAVSDGDAIFVRMGTYFENMVVNRTVSLTGEDSSTTIIDGGGTGHVVVITSDDVDLTGFTVQNSGTAYHMTGISLNNVNHCNVSGNIITNNEHGLEIYSSSFYNTVSRNNMTENSKWGMHIISSYNNNVSGNIIGGSLWGSIAIHGLSVHNRIFENSIGNNDNVGINVDNSDHNYIYENNITNNLWGVSIQYGARYNAISCNNIANNDYGIKLESNTFANTVYHNNFLDNTFQTSIVGRNFANSWDDGYPSGGNFWSDYEDRYPDAQELGSSGIWNTAYEIDENNQDNYPLIEPWSLTPPIPTTIDELKIEIEELRVEGEIDNQGIARSLIAKLNVTQKLIDKEKTDQAIMVLERFIVQVQKHLSGIHVTVEAADIVIESSEYIMSQI